MKKIESLNLFRGICGYGVAICHYYAYLKNSSNFEYISFLFVDFFFVLSGFVLYAQLLKVYNNKKNLKIFYIRRWMRTLPIFFIALIFFSLFFNNYSYDTLKYLFFIQKIYPNFVKNDYFFVAWSLSIEEWFYFIFPIFLILFNKLSIGRIFLYFLIFIYFLKLIFLFNYDLGDFYRTGTFLRLDAILFGAIVAHYYNIIKKLKYDLILLVFLLFLYFFFKDYFINSWSFIKIFYIIIIQTISVLTLLFFIKINKNVNFKNLNNVYTLLANQTYSVYLFHFLIIYFIKTYHLESINFIFIYYLLSLFFISSLIYYLIEKKILNYRPTYD